MTRRLSYFKAYDIRGAFPDPLNAEAAYRIGRAAAEWTSAEEVVLGRDARLSSPVLAEAAMAGLTDGGTDVLDLGVVSTPMLNFAVSRFRRFGLMVTASHNPKDDNGIKVIDPNVEQVYYGRGLEIMERMVLENRFKSPSRRGSVRLRSILLEYENALADHFMGAGLSALSVVVDCSSGVGGLPLGVLERLGIRHRLLYHIPDGNFPHHGCDTLRMENLADLREEVRLRGADAGVMFDGDSDRVVFVDGRGDPAPLDLVFVLLARRELSRRPGRVFYDLRFSRSVKEEIEKLGGIPERIRVGNPFHKEALHRHEDAVLAAELSGHIMYKEHSGIDDPLFASLKLLSCLAEEGKPLSDLIAPLRRYAGSGEIRIPSKDPAALVNRVKDRYRDGTLSEVDGVTVDYPDWWFNLRPSNTEPVAKLVIEAAEPELLARKRSELTALLGGGSEI